MRVALVSDIHANLPALEAVLEDIAKQDVDAIWNLGDLVGYGAFPDRVIRKLRENDILSVRGEFDSRVLKSSKKRAKWRQKKRPEVFLSIYWAAENLSEPSLDYLRTLPEEIRIRLGSTRLILTHGNPASKKEAVTSGMPDAFLQELLIQADAQILLCGHSHQSFCRETAVGFIVNPGSVGLQSDGDPRASYAILELEPDLIIEDPEAPLKLSFHTRRIDYGLEEAVNEIRRRGLPEAFAQILIQGRDLPTVLQNPEKWVVPELEEQSWWKSLFQGRTRQEYEDLRIKQIIDVIGGSNYDEEHVKQATFLALRLFDELQPLHRLSPDERFWLRCASLLHDIGKGDRRHHLKAQKLILNSRDLPLTPRERRIIGLIARYHRGEGPKDGDDELTVLPVVDQRIVTILSSLLRVADGLDATPRGNVTDLSCSYSAAEITIKCLVKDQARRQKKRALGKGELMEFAFDRELYIEWHHV
jgi:putative phosphoesterase